MKLYGIVWNCMKNGMKLYGKKLKVIHKLFITVLSY